MLKETGILKVKFPIEVKTASFQVRDFVLVLGKDTDYPQEVLFQLTQDRCDLIDPILIGEKITVEFSLRGKYHSGQHGDKYYNNLDVKKIAKAEKH